VAHSVLERNPFFVEKQGKSFVPSRYGSTRRTVDSH
jgi:hypothetical protein